MESPTEQLWEPVPNENCYREVLRSSKESQGRELVEFPAPVEPR